MTHPVPTEGREGQQHTPGPWRTFATPQKIEILCSDRVAPNRMPSADSKIAEVRFRRIARGGAFAGNDVDEANAALIAAAPDGLALAYAVAAHFEGTDAPLGKMARDFIALAEGR